MENFFKNDVIIIVKIRDLWFQKSPAVLEKSPKLEDVARLAKNIRGHPHMASDFGVGRYIGQGPSDGI